MKDKDTRLLEETYNKIHVVNEEEIRIDPNNQNNLSLPTKKDVEFVTEDIESTRVIEGVGVKGDWVLCNKAHWVKLMRAAAHLDALESIKTLG